MEKRKQGEHKNKKEHPWRKVPAATTQKSVVKFTKHEYRPEEEKKILLEPATKEELQDLCELLGGVTIDKTFFQKDASRY